ncbi:hypothetical protein V5799_027014, partial [Amblyomma americanum]
MIRRCCRKPLFGSSPGIMAGIGDDAPSNMTSSEGDGAASQSKSFGTCCEQHAVESPANASPPMNRRGSDASQCLTTNGMRPRGDDSVAPIASNSGQVLFNWQASKSTVQERLAFLFNKEILSDVRFLVGRGAQQQRLPAHKFVLSVGSAVFDAMFNGALATNAEEVELPDVEPAAFLALLKFLYSDQVQIGAETVMTTLYTAKKYAVPALEKACVDFLQRQLSSDNAFLLLAQARLFDEPQLAALCLDTIDKCTAEALAAEGFVDIDRDTLCAVLERDTLRIREVKLFAAALRFAVDRKIFVLGYGLYGSIHGPSDYDVNIQLVQTGTGQVLGSHDTSFNSDGSPARFRVLFKSPVEVAPNVNYTACATLK